LEKFERFNPISKIGNWSKPILVIHGGRDRRVPLEQGLAAYTMAQRMGVPSKFLYYPDENHWVQKPQNSVQWYRTVQDWMVRWTRQDADCEVSA
jgi:dipeptidyl aminopeptidase/acylaminoacyl peptidase